MNLYEMLDKQFDRLKDLFEQGYLSEEQYFDEVHYQLDKTTECASQTDRAGEQCDEVGLVQLPDNAVTSELVNSEAETNGNHDSNFMRNLKVGNLFTDDGGLHIWEFSRIGGTGCAILHPPGEPDMQSSLAVDIDILRTKYEKLS